MKRKNTGHCSEHTLHVIVSTLLNSETTSRAVQHKFPLHVFIQQTLSESRLSHASTVWAPEQEAMHRPRPGARAVDTHTNVTTEITGTGKTRTREGRLLRPASAVHVQGSLRRPKAAVTNPCCSTKHLSSPVWGWVTTHHLR